MWYMYMACLTGAIQGHGLPARTWDGRGNLFYRPLYGSIARGVNGPRALVLEPRNIPLQYIRQSLVYDRYSYFDRQCR